MVEICDRSNVLEYSIIFQGNGIGGTEKEETEAGEYTK